MDMNSVESFLPEPAVPEEVIRFSTTVVLVTLVSVESVFPVFLSIVFVVVVVVMVPELLELVVEVVVLGVKVETIDTVVSVFGGWPPQLGPVHPKSALIPPVVVVTPPIGAVGGVGPPVPQFTQPPPHEPS
jgi:hypothetical protein